MYQVLGTWINSATCSCTAFTTLAGEWPKTAVDDEVQEQVSWHLETGVMRQATLPRIILLKD